MNLVLKKKSTVVKSKKIIIAIFYRIMTRHLKEVFSLDLVFEAGSK